MVQASQPHRIEPSEGSEIAPPVARLTGRKSGAHGPKGAAEPESVDPWWRVGMVWLVIGGPLTVVVAGVVTAVIAVRGADPVLTPAERAAFSERPALQGRNHAATGEVPSRP